MKIAKIILLAIGAILLCYGISVVALIGFGSIFNFVFVIGGLAIGAVGYFLDKIFKLNKWLLIAVGAVLLLCLINFTVFEAKLVSAAVDGDKIESADGIVIVLGAKVNSDGNPKSEFAARLRRAEEVCSEQNILILTGGQGSDEPVSEAEGAYNYLENRGKVQAKVIYLEDKSTSTYENLQNALEIIKQNGGSESSKITIVSSAFHLYRAKQIAELVGFSDVSGVGSYGLYWLLPFYCVREYAAYVAGKI